MAALKFSANLGFLWADLPLPEAILRAHAAGFDAVECHWPYETRPEEIRAALQESGLPMLGLNTRRGDVEAGENGLCALPGREAEARDAIDEAVAYGVEIGARHVHVMAGNAEGLEARRVFTEAAAYAADVASVAGLRVVIEPLNPWDAPGYFLRSTDQAGTVLDEVGAENLRMMFDVYHVGRSEGDVIDPLRRHFGRIGHIQIASVPDRGAPDRGIVDYGAVFSRLREMGWAHPIGAEYRPEGAPEDSLGWLAEARA